MSAASGAISQTCKASCRRIWDGLCPVYKAGHLYTSKGAKRGVWAFVGNYAGAQVSPGNLDRWNRRKHGEAETIHPASPQCIWSLDSGSFEISAFGKMPRARVMQTVRKKSSRLRACLTSPRACLDEEIFRHSSLFSLKIHKVFLRLHASIGEKSPRQSAHVEILNRL